MLQLYPHTLNLLKTVVLFTALTQVCPNSGGSSDTGTSVPTSTTGSLEVKLKQYVGGSAGSGKTPCTPRLDTITATSTAGSPQSKTVSLSGSSTVYDECSQNNGYVTCYCPTSVLFDKLAPGTWTLTNDNYKTCKVDVQAGISKQIIMYTDKACTDGLGNPPSPVVN